MIRTFLLAAALSGAAVPAFAEAILGVDGTGVFVRFDSATPGNIAILGAATGIGAGETIIGIDRRPANGQIFAFTTANNLYRVAFGGGLPTATLIGTLNTPIDTSAGLAFDFNPIPDRIRIENTVGQNRRANPANAVAIIDGALNYAAGDVNADARPNIVAAGYTNSFSPSPRTPPPGTALYVIDADLDILAIQNPPNAGVLNTIGSLGIDVSARTAFDISGVTGIAYLASANAVGSLGINEFYTVNLATGAATLVGAIAGNRIFAITVADVPAPGGLALFGLGAMSFALARRRRA